MSKEQAFTLMELMITITIMGVMATFLVPRLTGMSELGKAGEGNQILISLRGAQLRYCLDHTCSAGTYPASCGTYDVDLPALKYFNAPVCANTGVISVQRIGGAYTFNVSTAGVYSCSGSCSLASKVLPK